MALGDSITGPLHFLALPVAELSQLAAFWMERGVARLNFGGRVGLLVVTLVSARFPTFCITTPRA